MTNDTKLPASTSWLFAFGSIAAGIGTSYAASGLGQKATAAIYFAIVAIGGFASTYLTRARTRTAVLAFLTAAVVAAGAYFVLVDAIFHTVTTAAGSMANDPNAAAAGAKMGKIFGVFVAVIVFLETTVAGIGGAVAGDKSRGKGGLGALGALARASR